VTIGLHLNEDEFAGASITVPTETIWEVWLWGCEEDWSAKSLVLENRAYDSYSKVRFWSIGPLIMNMI
jgi:hypothetical protein